MTHKQCPRCFEHRRVQDFYVGREVCTTCISTANRKRREDRANNRDGINTLLAGWKRVSG